MKKIIKAYQETPPLKDEYAIKIKNSDWYRFITRVEKATGMKVTYESKFDTDRDYIELEDEYGNTFEADVDKEIYYKFNGKDLTSTSW